MHDFAVKYNPKTDTSEDITKKILYSIFIKPLKNKKPRVLFISGDSGEGKSYAALRLQEILCGLQGIDVKKHFNDMNVFTPLEYPQKLDRLLNDKELKKVNILCMHEAREIIKAKNWHSFLTQAIADVNAMSRSIKRICFIIISQFIRDITSDVRYTLNYYITMKRTNSVTKMTIMRVWKDDHDLEKPRLRKRRIFGYLVYPNGRYKKFKPDHLIVHKPDEELVKEFDRLDTESKRAIIRRKVNRLISDMKDDLNLDNDKVKSMVGWYLQNPDKIVGIGKMRANKFVLNKDFEKMHDLDRKEKEEFVLIMTKELREKGLIEKSWETPAKEQHDDGSGEVIV